MIYYNCIVGSRAYGMAIEQSDIDVLYVTNDGINHGMQGKTHIITYTPESFCKLLPVPEKANMPYLIQWLFPAEILETTALSKLVVNVREEIVCAARPDIYQAFMEKADGLAARLYEMYPAFPKRAAYSCLFYNMIARHAAGATFAEAHRPDENFRQWLLAVRRREIDMGEIAEENKRLRTQAVAASGFYHTSKDERYLADVGAQMREILRVVR